MIFFKNVELWAGKFISLEYRITEECSDVGFGFL